MLARKTCLLLGAGASQHLGFPLGLELKERMLEKLYDQTSQPPDRVHKDFKRSGEDLSLFFERLLYGNWTSPDTFLEHNPEFIKTGKFLICRLLSSVESPNGLKKQWGWYDRLISSIHTDDYRKLKDNNLSIVTFNYDRSIDFRLHKYIENHFRLTSDEAWNVLTDSIPIVHVHGMIGTYPESAYGANDLAYERGQAIKIIHEIDGETAEFKKASELLNSADRVVVFGFGFAPDNVRRLKFFREQKHEDRDIIIAAGPSRGTNSTKQHLERLSRWGLLQKTHAHMTTADDFFCAISDPFV